MTPLQVNLLTPEQKVIKLATLYGFTGIDTYEDNAGPPILHGKPPSHHPLKFGRPDETIPPFLTSLDALSLLEHRIEAWRPYAEALQERYGEAWGFTKAPQRADLLLEIYC